VGNALAIHVSQAFRIIGKKNWGFKESFLLVIHFSDDFGRDTEDDDIVRDIFINETKSPNY
jgi:hypothetical protein